MRAFADGYYKSLKAMYDYLGVSYRPQRFLFNFLETTRKASGRGVGNASTYFTHASNYHRSPPFPPSTGTTIAHFVHIAYLLVCYVWFTLCCFYVPPRTSSNGVPETVDEYFKRIRIPEYFVAYFVLPMMSSVATCSHQSFLASPASDLTSYKRKTHGMQHYVVTNGVKEVQDKLAKGIACELSASVLAVNLLHPGVQLSWRRTRGAVEGILQDSVFDRVILAVPPDVVGRIFKPLSVEMANIPTVQVESIAHNDWNVYAWASGKQEDLRLSTSSLYLRTSTADDYYTEATHVHQSGTIVTTSPLDTIDPALVLRSSRFTRVLRTVKSSQSVNDMFRVTRNRVNDVAKTRSSHWQNGDEDVWLVGSWCWDGMVLLEGCIVSAMRVADAFGVDVPWRLPAREPRECDSCIYSLG